MTRYITCQKDMSEVPEWHCSNNCEDCVYYEFYKEGGYWDQVVSEFDDIHKHHIASARKENHSNRRRNS